MFTFFNTLQLIGGLILAVGYLPQIIKIGKTKSVRDFSRIYLGGIFTGIVFMEAYAVYMFFWQHTAGAFLATNTISFVLSGIEFAMVMAYWNRPEKIKYKL
ncbi:PQ-loop repeat-containing protein [Priestia aryabhattai]|uniref:PQ-loop repeat-containing protein n=1 Tax=Priestia aryabhattai TaxID=412384 RepID=UPI00288126BA|nr:PQ-loop repeat-containing protein [Priestia aryabhattai]MDT0150036.1 PQ-loop repeat-containing protein [Priestia aryabhattai]MDT0155606.1 PQ-loop repeat-containing protein [Priestia aryabhattai]